MEHTTEENIDRNLHLRIWTKISDETGIRVEMVGHIHQSITRKRKNEIHINSKNVTHFIIQDLIDNDNGSIQDILEYNGIKSSEDFGTVVKRLCEEGVIIKEKNDNYEDFKSQFTTASIIDFIKNNNLKKDRDWFITINYSLYVIGLAIVLSSYLDFISNEIGWLGWGIGMLGWALITFKSQITDRLSKVLNMNKV
ncbi:hypothetical protein [Sporocytophaga myxococcoides]|uniref:hypothetical protein n=1 Tax=Sporocytophaga myxococcoides TaxID=153721 RepID=UPI00041D225E|nr:hypothetical protein [Sporocytophaga myxococcoides]